MLDMHKDHGVEGFTTNPTLCRAAHVPDYFRHAEFLTHHLPEGLPLSMEVTADDAAGMLRQALRLADVGPNLYVKIPVCHVDGTSTNYVTKQLQGRGVKVNVTAITTPYQFRAAARTLAGGPPAFLSVFAGRIADAGSDPTRTMEKVMLFTRQLQATNLQVIWASTREVLNIRQADNLGVDIITVTPPILAKRKMLDTPVDQLSMQIVRQFHRDGQEAGYDF